MTIEFKPLEERFRAKVRVMPADDRHTGPWLAWFGAVNRGGYGVLGKGGRKDGTIRAHRLACTLAHGEPPFPGAQAAHECAVRHCVTPACLSWKTPKGNSEDMVRHGNSTLSPVCVNGHDTRVTGRYESGGCKTCIRNRAAKVRLEKKQRD